MTARKSSVEDVEDRSADSPVWGAGTRSHRAVQAEAAEVSSAAFSVTQSHRPDYRSAAPSGRRARQPKDVRRPAVRGAAAVAREVPPELRRCLLHRGPNVHYRLTGGVSGSFLAATHRGSDLLLLIPSEQPDRKAEIAGSRLAAQRLGTA